MIRNKCSPNKPTPTHTQDTDTGRLTSKTSLVSEVGSAPHDISADPRISRKRFLLAALGWHSSSQPCTSNWDHTHNHPVSHQNETMPTSTINQSNGTYMAQSHTVSSKWCTCYYNVVMILTQYWLILALTVVKIIHNYIITIHTHTHVPPPPPPPPPPRSKACTHACKTHALTHACTRTHAHAPW